MSRKRNRMKGITEPTVTQGQGREFLSREQADVHDALMNGQGWDGHNYMGDWPDETAMITTPSTAKQAKPQIDWGLVETLLKMQDIRLGGVPNVYALDKLVTWILAGNGVFQVRKTQYGPVVVQISKAVMPGLPEWDPPKYEWPLPKLPWAVFSPAVAFLRWVKVTYDTEGLIRAYWNCETQHEEHAGWTIDVPEQRVTSVSVDVANTVADPGLGIFAMEMHSHPGSGSTFSGTDDDNEQRERMFGCVAGLTDAPKPPNFHWRMGTGAPHWAPMKLADIVVCDSTLTFEMTPMACLDNALAFDPFGSAVFPEAWKARVSAPPKRVQSWSKDAQLTQTTLEDAEIVRSHNQAERDYWRRKMNGGGGVGSSGGGSYSGRSWKP